MEANTGPSKFKGKSLLESIEDVFRKDFLGGDFGKAILKEYTGRAEKDYGNKNALKVLSYSEGIVKGSNPFAVVLLNQILRQKGLRTAANDLKSVLRVTFLKDTYEDAALVLRSEENPNSYLAKDLHFQINERLGKKANLPVMLPLIGLDLVNDSDSNYGLAFRLREDINLICSPVLNKKTVHSASEDIDEKARLLKKFGSGSETLYEKNSGLSRLDLDFSDDLSYSTDNGRVVVVSTQDKPSKN